MGIPITINGHELNTFDMHVDPNDEYLVTVGKTASSVNVERVRAEPDDALIEENKKLRELVLDVVEGLSLGDIRDWSYGHRLRILDEARELGIEVDE